jgi:hypothetical protein
VYANIVKNALDCILEEIDPVNASSHTRSASVSRRLRQSRGASMGSTRWLGASAVDLGLHAIELMVFGTIPIAVTTSPA